MPRITDSSPRINNNQNHATPLHGILFNAYKNSLDFYNANKPLVKTVAIGTFAVLAGAFGVYYNYDKINSLDIDPVLDERSFYERNQNAFFLLVVSAVTGVAHHLYLKVKQSRENQVQREILEDPNPLYSRAGLESFGSDFEADNNSLPKEDVESTTNSSSSTTSNTANHVGEEDKVETLNDNNSSESKESATSTTEATSTAIFSVNLNFVAPEEHDAPKLQTLEELAKELELPGLEDNNESIVSGEKLWEQNKDQIATWEIEFFGTLKNEKLIEYHKDEQIYQKEGSSNPEHKKRLEKLNVNIELIQEYINGSRETDVINCVKEYQPDADHYVRQKLEESVSLDMEHVQAKEYADAVMKSKPISFEELYETHEVELPSNSNSLVTT